MSIRVKIDDIPFEKREKMSTDLSLKLEVSKYGSFGKPQYFEAYEDYVSVPYAYAVNHLEILKLKSDIYDAFEKKLKFTGSVGTDLPRGSSLILFRELLGSNVGMSD